MFTYLTDHSAYNSHDDKDSLTQRASMFVTLFLNRAFSLQKRTIQGIDKRRLAASEPGMSNSGRAECSMVSTYAPVFPGRAAKNQATN